MEMKVKHGNMVIEKGDRIIYYNQTFGNYYEDIVIGDGGDFYRNFGVEVIMLDDEGKPKINKLNNKTMIDIAFFQNICRVVGRD